MEAFVARQPIFNKNNEVFAYELLYRKDKEHNSFDNAVDPDMASGITIINSFVEIGLSKLTNGRKAFINCTETLLLNNVPALLPTDLLVVEILEDIKATPEMLAACEQLKKAGYQLALDDYILSADNEDFIKYADIIKLDFITLEVHEIAKFVDYLHCRRDLEQKPILLAEKIENEEMFNIAVKLGFTYFQGYYFSKPVIVSGRTLNPISIHRIQIMKMVMQEELDFDHLTEIVRKDVALSFRLLKLVNSAYFAFSTRINNIHQALVILGSLAIKKWMALLCLSEINPSKTTELTRMSIVRARFLEYIALEVSLESEAETLYMIGMFSLLDVIMESPMDEILQQLSLDSNVTETLIRREGLYYEFLHIIIDYEKGLFDSALERASKFSIAKETLSRGYIEAVEWESLLGI